MAPGEASARTVETNGAVVVLEKVIMASTFPGLRSRRVAPPAAPQGILTTVSA
ncbi:MAG: hypothetical protein ABR970_07135 [Roseiarcus sp.]